MANQAEIMWAAGLFEGEGCFTLSKKRSREGRYLRYPRAALESTDEDTVRRFARIVGFGNVRGPNESPKGHKPSWRWRVGGLKNIQCLALILWPGLMRRRRACAMRVTEYATRPRRLGWKAVEDIRSRYKGRGGPTQAELAHEYGVHKSTIYEVTKGRTWQTV